MEHKSTWLTPPPLHNSTCTPHPRYWVSGEITLWGVTQAMFILMLSVGILTANLLVILVINSRRYSKYIHSQPRYLLTSLASNDLAIGLFVTPTGILPALHHCWPYGEIFCQIQSLMRGALCQQSAVILICMAIDRYMCMLHPVRYHKHSNKKGCVLVISLTWVTSVTLFAAMVLPRGGYYFNSTGLLACDPFFPRPSLRILNSCFFYFPTTMVLMYCYGSAFHVNRLRLHRGVVCSPTRPGAERKSPCYIPSTAAWPCPMGETEASHWCMQVPITRANRGRVLFDAEYRGALVTDGFEDMDCRVVQAVERVGGAACASAEERDKGLTEQ